MSTEESEIVERLQSDDQTALSIVFKEIVPRLWPLLTRNFREALSNEDIEEVIATALGKLWQNRTKFDGAKGDLQGWFYVILRNCALDRIRRKRPRVQEFLVVEPLSPESGSDEEKQKLLQAAISNLNQRELQTILPLFEKTGVSVSDLSERLRVSTGAIRQLRFRALRKLDAALAEHGYTTRRVRSVPSKETIERMSDHD